MEHTHRGRILEVWGLPGTGISIGETLTISLSQSGKIMDKRQARVYFKVEKNIESEVEG